MARVRGRARCGALVALSLLFSAFASDAAAQTWTGAGADNNWSTGANWSGGVPPASSAATQLAFAASARMSPVVDAAWTINRLDIAGPPGPPLPVIYHFTGQPITFAGAAPALTSNSSSAFPGTFTNPMVLAVPTGIGLGSGSYLQLNGVISGPGSLSVAGLGFIALSAANTFTGGMTVASGATMALNGSVPGPVTVGDAGGLGGAGTVGGPVTVASGGFLSPTTMHTGSLTLPGELDIGIGGTIPGAQYSTLNVTGVVDVTAGSLRLIGTYVPFPGDVFTIVTNDGADPVVGIFGTVNSEQGGGEAPVTGPFTEGATIPFNGVSLRLSYVGGTGNDITLTAFGPRPLFPGPLDQVPTLSEWALVLLAMMMLAMGALRAGRRR